MTEDKNAKPTNRAGRGPSYPGMSLRSAVDKLKTYYAAQRANAVSVEGALKSLGHASATSGSALRTIATLTSFGLLTDDGSGQAKKVRITDIGKKIVILPESDKDRLQALREAALNPRVYRDLFQAWDDGLPSDDEIFKYLTFTKGYSEEAAITVRRDFKDTYEFAKLGDYTLNQVATGIRESAKETSVQTPINSDHSQIVWPSNNAQASTSGNNQLPPVSGERNYTIPLLDGRMALLSVPKSLTQEDWDFIKQYLELFKNALITSKPAIPLQIRTGSAVWHSADFDQPVTVTGYAGVQNGKHFVTIEGSSTGLPLDEISFDDDQG